MKAAATFKETGLKSFLFRSSHHIEGLRADSTARHFPAMYTWASHLTSLCLSFLTCKVKTAQYLCHEAVVKIT